MRPDAARSNVPIALRAAFALATAALVSVLLLTPSADARHQARPMTITMGDFFYTPKVVRAEVGQTVRFVNRGKLDHTVADVNAKGAILARAIRPKLLSTGDAQLVVLRRTGTIRYACTLHPTRMSGTIVVGR